MSYLGKPSLARDTGSSTGEMRSDADALGESSTRQAALISALADLCLRFDIPQERARGTARHLLQDEYITDLSLPASPSEVRHLWSKRDQAEKKMTPVAFLDKYWRDYISDGLLTQSNLQLLDKPLFDAIKYQCRSKKKGQAECLPPPSRPRARQCHKENLLIKEDSQNSRLCQVLKVGKKINSEDCSP